MLMLQVATIFSQPSKFCMACHFILFTLFLADTAGLAGFFSIVYLTESSLINAAGRKYCLFLTGPDNLVDMSGIVLKT